MYTLFEPLVIKSVVLKNRMVMPPMALDIASEKGEVTSKQLEHYLARSGAFSNISQSHFGIGLIIVEHSYINPAGRAHPCQLGIYEDFLIDGLKQLTDEIHKRETTVGIQISHAGARALDKPSAPSAIDCPELARFGHKQGVDRELPTELSTQQIRELVNDYAKAAGRAKEAGFDLLEIHGAHGYLLNQFYSPLTNQRKDSYGGNLEKRLRFSLEVIEAVKGAVGNDMPVFYRLGADDRLPGGNNIEDSMKAVSYMVEAGVDCIDLSGGIGGYIKKGPEGFFNYMAEKIKKVSKVPILVTGGITKPLTAEKLIRNKQADLAGIGRALLSDPDWARKAWQGLENVETKSP